MCEAIFLEQMYHWKKGNRLISPSIGKNGFVDGVLLRLPKKNPQAKAHKDILKKKLLWIINDCKKFFKDDITSKRTSTYFAFCEKDSGLQEM